MGICKPSWRYTRQFDLVRAYVLSGNIYIYEDERVFLIKNKDFQIMDSCKYIDRFFTNGKKMSIDSLGFVYLKDVTHRLSSFRMLQELAR